MATTSGRSVALRVLAPHWPARADGICPGPPGPTTRFGPGPQPDEAPEGLVFPEGYVPGRSSAMLELYEQMRALARSDAPLLLMGETGVGKEMLALALHASSQRRGGPFVAVNCAAIPSELLEAEMFGIAKGVASGVSERPGRFQLASGGTLFLDEIGDMPLPLQAKLLRALQGGEIEPVGGMPVRLDVRVLTATNAELQETIAQGRFRRDLYYRVAGFELRIPPLRERRDDIPALVEALLRVFAAEVGRPVPPISTDAMRALVGYGWPGNVRELEHEMRRLVYLCPERHAIEAPMLSERLLVAREPEIDVPPSSLSLEVHIEHLERRLVRAALSRTGGRRSPAARLLGISRNGLAMKMDRLGIVDPRVGCEG